jgi:membrane protease YdiL (CAAX protease family)
MAQTLVFWNKLPVILRALLAGTIVATVGTFSWALVSVSNQLVWRVVPWAVGVEAFVLWIFWRYCRGEGWPAATSEARRSSMRANPVSPDVWGAAVFAGMLGFAALMPFSIVLARLVRLPAEAQPIDAPSEIPALTVFLLLAMASVVAGVVEEVAFRGYMQGPIERRYGVVPAILVTGSAFGLAHFLHHPAGVLPMLPYYIAAAAIYGGLAWATNSIFPGIVLHALGDIFVFLRLWLTGKPEWELTAVAPPLVWESGPDAAFFGALAAFIVLGGVALWAYIALADSVRRDPMSVVTGPRRRTAPSS